MKRCLGNQQGFTLVELMLGLTITVILLAGIFGLLSTSLQSWRLGSGRTELQQTARYAMDKMTRDLHYGKNFSLKDPYTIVFDDATDSSTYGNTYQYQLDTTDHILYRQPVSPSGTRQPVTGANVQYSTNVLLYPGTLPLYNLPLFVLSDLNTVKIIFTAIDTNTNQSITMQTAVNSQPVFLHLEAR